MSGRIIVESMLLVTKWVCRSHQIQGERLARFGTELRAHDLVIADGSAMLASA
jgi:hypothetical protein